MVNIAFVGVAHIHTPGFIKRLKDRPDVKCKYVWDHDAERAKKRADELGCKAVKSASKIWNDPEINGVIVCSETNLHKKLVLAGVKAKKHMFVEKPLALGSSDGYAMAKAIQDAGLIFQTGYMQRGSPINMFIKQQIDAGNFGRITRVRGSNCHGGALGDWFATEWRWMAQPKIAGCGGYGDLGTHALDILLWWMGGVESVTASIASAIDKYPDCDEFGEGLLKFKNGATGTLASGWVDVANPVQYIISGTEGHAHVVGGKLYFQSKKVEGADGKEPWTNLPAALPGPLEMFLDAIGGKPDLPLVKVGEAAYVCAVMEALYQGAKKNRWIAPKSE